MKGLPTRVLAYSVVEIVIGYLDYLTTPNFNLTLLYILPVVAAGWTLPRRPAIIVALVASAASLNDATFVTDTTLWWNAISRTTILTFAAIATTRIRRDRDRLVVQDAQRAKSLDLLERGLAEPGRQLLELARHWDGSVYELKRLVERRADELIWLARDFSAIVRLQDTELALNPTSFDFVALVDELRQDQQTGERHMLMSAPSTPLMVRGDQARIRQTLSAIIGERATGGDLSLLVTGDTQNAELTISSGDYHPGPKGHSNAKDGLGVAVEFAQLLFSAQGGSIDFARNPLTRSLRIVARLPRA